MPLPLSLIPNPAVMPLPLAMKGICMPTRQRSQSYQLGAALAAALCLYPLTTPCSAQSPAITPGQNMMMPPRWSVMTGTDPGTASISPKPVKTTLDKLSSLPRPAALPIKGQMLPIYHTTRVGTGEKTLWSVNAKIVESQLNPDGDYHFVLKSASGQRIVCELPDPKLMQHPGPFAKQMVKARAAVAAKLHTTTTPRNSNVSAHVTGLGYYGRVRPGDGGPENGIQLHPVVSVTFP